MEDKELIEFTPATVAFGDFDSLSKQINAFVDQRSNLAVAPETKKEVTHAKNEVGSYFKQLDDRRKQVKREYEAPLKAFESQFKQVTAPLVDLKSGYMADLRSIDEMDKEQRRVTAMGELSQMCEAAGVDPDEVAFDDKWLNVGARKFGKYESNTATLREMQNAVTYAVNQKQLAAERIKRIKEHAVATNQAASGWTNQVTAETDADEVIAKMDAAQVQERHEERRKSVDRETGEVTHETRTLRITGAVGRVDKLVQWLAGQGFEVTVLG